MLDRFRSRVSGLADGLEMRCKRGRRIEKVSQVSELSNLVNHGAIC